MRSSKKNDKVQDIATPDLINQTPKRKMTYEEEKSTNIELQLRVSIRVNIKT